MPTTDDPIRLVVADDTMIVRQGVVSIVDRVPGVTVVAQCGDLPSLLDAVDEHEPDVVLTDVCMPPSMSDEGIRAARHIRAERGATGVVVLSQYAEPEYVLQLFEQGSDHLGYLLKEHLGDPAELERAIHTVASGGSVVDPRIVEVLVAARTSATTPVDRLTPRERDVMALIAEGLNNAAIAERLVLSDKAVAKHINSIFSKLDLGESEDAHKRVMAVLTWLAAS
jgi:DNA-binding NarL/FixJ family response regulator